MKDLKQLTTGIWTTNNEAEVYFFIRDRESSVSEDSLFVKSYYEENDFLLAVFDGNNRVNSFLILIENFVYNEDKFHHLNEIFSETLRDSPNLTSIRKAKFVIEEAITMLPTFRAFFDKKG